MDFHNFEGQIDNFLPIFDQLLSLRERKQVEMHIGILVFIIYLSPLKFRLPLIFATRVAKIKGGELQTMLGWRKLKAGEI